MRHPAGRSGGLRGNALADTPVVPYAGAVPDGGRQGSRRRRPSPAPLVSWPRTPPFQGGGTGSNPVGGTVGHMAGTDGPVEQPVSSPPCQGGGRGFKSRQDR